MCDDDIHVGLIHDPTVSRRTFGLMTAAGAAGIGTVATAQANVVEKDVEVKTADGVADAVLFHPSGKGTWPGVLIWPDIAGLRPAFREMGRRLAAQGYVVLVPNPFYRSAKGVVAGEGFNFSMEAPLTVGELVGAIQRVMGLEGIEADIRNEAKGEIRDQHLSAAKARAVLGWSAEYTLETGLEETVAWYRDYYSTMGQAG